MKYIPQLVMARDFPASVDHNEKKYRSLQRWIHWRYGNYSESILTLRSIRSFPSLYGLPDLGSARRPAVREFYKMVAEYTEAETMLSDTHGIMPGVVFEHFESRLAGYVVAKRNWRLHNGLTGISKRRLPSHLIVQADRNAKLIEIYDVWSILMRCDQWHPASVGEHWGHGQIVARSAGKRSLKVEIWHDRREFHKKIRLPKVGDVFG